MKKIICSVLIAIISLIQFLPVFADGQVNVTNLLWDDIEKYILYYNPDVYSNKNSAVGNETLSNSVNSLTSLRDSVELRIDSMRSKMSVLDSSSIDSDIKDYLSDVYLNVINIFGVYSIQLQGQINSMQSQYNNSVANSTRITMSNNAIVSSAQQLYSLYCSLMLQKEDMVNKSAEFDTQVSISKIKNQLGMINENDLNDILIQSEELKNSIKELDNNINNIKGQLNVMLSQSFDNELKIGTIPVVNDTDIASMDYVKDLATGLSTNYEIIMMGKTDDYRMANLMKKYNLSFDQKYKGVLNKKQVVDTAKNKLSREEKKLEGFKLKYDMGLISKVDFDKQDNLCKSQVINLKTAQNDLRMAYTAYKWLLRGYDIPSK